jgi:hypothetical protein
MPTGILRSILEDAPDGSAKNWPRIIAHYHEFSWGKRAFLPLEPGFYYSKFSLCKAQKIKRN